MVSIYPGERGRALRVARISCHTDFVQKRITIRISDDAALWARRKAAEENTSVSRLVGEMLEREMRLTDAYWAAYERFKTIGPSAQVSAARRMTREETNARR